MAEGGALGPEVVYVAKAEASPLDGVKRKVFDFVKSQRPSEHARRAMEKYTWVGEHLDGKAKELHDRLRPVAEQAAKIGGVATTTMEVVMATQVAAGLAILAGAKGKDLLMNKELREKATGGVKGVATRVGKEVTGIVKGAYDKTQQAVIAGLGLLGGGAALEKIKGMFRRGERVSDGSVAADPHQKENTNNSWLIIQAKRLWQEYKLLPPQAEAHVPSGFHVLILDGSQPIDANLVMKREDFESDRTMHTWLYVDWPKRAVTELNYSMDWSAVTKASGGRVDMSKEDFTDFTQDWINGKIGLSDGQRAKMRSLNQGDMDEIDTFMKANPYKNEVMTNSWAEKLANPQSSSA